jgi:prepilin-type N-terminal cleavage/methylation domain-containing protein
MTDNKKGFTMIELLVVVLIIGILAAIALPRYQEVIFKTKMKNFARVLESVKRAKDFCKQTSLGLCDTIEVLPIEFNCTQTSGHICSNNLYRMEMRGGGAYGSEIYGVPAGLALELHLKKDGKFYCYPFNDAGAKDCLRLVTTPGQALPDGF